MYQYAFNLNRWDVIQYFGRKDENGGEDSTELLIP